MFRVHSSPLAYPWPLQRSSPAHVHIESIDEISAASPVMAALLVGTFLFMLHGAEEYFSGFETEDPVWQWFYPAIFGWIDQHTAFLIFHFGFWLMLIVGLFLIRRHIASLLWLSVVATVMILESYHAILALGHGRYTDGSLTSIPLALGGLWLGWEIYHAWRQDALDEGGEHT